MIAIVVTILIAGATARAQPTPTTSPSFNEPRQKIAMDPIVVAQPAKEPVDQRPFYLVGGAMILAAIFIWNRAREKKLEAEHGPTPPRNRRWKVKRDADADELNDAAGRDDEDGGKP